jgi:hypothetical protein
MTHLLATGRAIQQSGDSVQFPLASHQRRRRAAGPAGLRSDRQQQPCGHRIATLDIDHLPLTQHRGDFDQPRSRLAEHHAARRGG